MSKKQYALIFFRFIQSIPKWLSLGLIAFICTGILFWPLRIISFTQLSTSLAGNSLKFWELLKNKDSRDAISTIATIFGGFFVFGNLIVVVENLKQTRKNNEINERRFESERALNESRLTSERFSKAIEHIGDKRLTTCLGGIYSLRYLSEEEPEKYHQESTRILAALIKALMSEVDRDLILVKSALDTLGNLASQRPCKRGEPDLRSVDFSKMDLSNSCLNRIFFYSSIFADANLHRATFKNSTLENSNFERANLFHTVFDKVNLLDANLTGSSHYYTSFVGATLLNAQLANSDLNLSDFSNAVLMNANLSGAFIKGTKFINANLIGATLIGIISSDAKIYISNSSAPIPSGQWPDFSNANLSKANLQKASFQNAVLDSVNFDGADITLTNFSGAKGLEPSQFRNTNWKDAVFDVPFRQRLELAEKEK